LAVWQAVGGGIWASRLPAIGTWGAVEEIGGSGVSARPEVAMAPNGDGLVVWEVVDSTTSVWANRYGEGEWGEPVPIESSDADSAFRQQVAIDPTGRGAAIWRRSDGSIWANRYVPGGVGWLTDERLDSDTGGGDYPHVALDETGNGMAVWEESDGVRKNLRARRYSAETSWGPTQLIETNNSGDVFRPRVATDPRGNALAVFAQDDGTRWNMWANRFE